jgi:hypothetical protein
MYIDRYKNDRYNDYTTRIDDAEIHLILHPSPFRLEGLSEAVRNDIENIRLFQTRIEESLKSGVPDDGHHHRHSGQRCNVCS